MGDVICFISKYELNTLCISHLDSVSCFGSVSDNLPFVVCAAAVADCGSSDKRLKAMLNSLSLGEVHISTGKT